MWQPQNPRDALSKADMLTKGVDATRHGLLGCVVGYGSGAPEQQARDYLLSEHGAGRMTEDEFHHWLARLVRWEKNNSIVMPPRAGSIDHSYPERRK